MNTKPFFAFSTFACLVALACGDTAQSDPDTRPTDPTPISVGVDAFGCPLVEPTPWSDAVDYDGFCGSDCQYYAGSTVDTDVGPLAVQDDRWFIACVSKDLNRPAGISPFSDVAPLCLVSPVDGYGYGFALLDGQMVRANLCWELCPGIQGESPCL